MREILSDDELFETSYGDTTDDGYTIDVSITESLKERTESLQVRLLEIALTISWTRGIKERSFTVRTLKLVSREI
jgi:hypothetical protein